MESDLSQAVSPVPPTPGVEIDAPDFSRRPNPDGSHRARIIGDRPTEPPSQKLTDLLARPRPTERQDNGARWQRNPLKERVSEPSVRGRRQPRHVVDAVIRAGMEEIVSAQPLTVTVTSSGQRMLTVDQAFYGQPRDRNWRPRPIREGAGKGPRKQAPVRRARC